MDFHNFFIQFCMQGYYRLLHCIEISLKKKKKKNNLAPLPVFVVFFLIQFQSLLSENAAMKCVIPFIEMTEIEYLPSNLRDTTEPNHS